MMIQKIQKAGVLYAIFVRAKDMKRIKTTQFFNSEMPLQAGVVAHHAGYVERAHYHKINRRTITGAEQMLYMAKGRMAVDFFDSKRKRFKFVVLKPGDMMVLLAGSHRIRVLEESFAPTVKLGPYPGLEHDKVNFDERK